MTLARKLLHSGDLFSAAVLGLADGILTALTLAAGLLTKNSRSLTIGFALRVAAAAFVSGAFVYFVAKYTEFRRQLVHAERELSLTSRGQFALNQLGRTIFREATLTTAVSSTSAFVGALGPLLTAVLAPRYRWASIAAALIALALLGCAMARSVYGSVLGWSLALVVGGVLITVAGIKLSVL